MQEGLMANSVMPQEMVTESMRTMHTSPLGKDEKKPSCIATLSIFRPSAFVCPTPESAVCKAVRLSQLA